MRGGALTVGNGSPAPQPHPDVEAGMRRIAVRDYRMVCGMGAHLHV